MNLSGKAAIVTGSGQGLGLAYAWALAGAGAAVVVNDVTAESAEGGRRHQGECRGDRHRRPGRGRDYRGC